MNAVRRAFSIQLLLDRPHALHLCVLGSAPLPLYEHLSPILHEAEAAR